MMENKDQLLPYFYPSDDGVRLEWDLNNTDASLEIDLDTKQAYWHELNLKTDEDYDKVLNLYSDDVRTFIYERIGKVLDNK